LGSEKMRLDPVKTGFWPGDKRVLSPARASRSDPANWARCGAAGPDRRAVPCEWRVVVNPTLSSSWSRLPCFSAAPTPVLRNGSTRVSGSTKILTLWLYPSVGNPAPARSFGKFDMAGCFSVKHHGRVLSLNCASNALPRANRLRSDTDRRWFGRTTSR